MFVDAVDARYFGAVSAALATTVTAELFAAASENVCNLTTKSGSGVAQLPHEHFIFEKSSLEVPQLDHAFMHGSQRKVQHLIMGAAI